MRKLLFRSRSGEGYPMVIAVTLCLLMLFMVIAEYFRVNIIVPVSYTHLRAHET